MEYQEIDTNQLNSVGGLDFHQIAKETFINVNKKLEHPPITISIGTHSMGGKVYPTAFGTDGNFSCIIGATKSMKTFLKSLVVASYIGGDTNKYAEDFKSHRDSDKYVLDFDTEQGAFHSQLTFKRVPMMVGSDYKNYCNFDEMLSKLVDNFKQSVKWNTKK